ncbi:MAG TPA: ATP-binding cassette domain-containing protein, partial [Acholeplasma sp.]
MAMIKVEHLTKSYGFQKGIFDLNFTVNEGEVVGFLGPNGAGKTTTIRHLLGFIKNYTGKAYINPLDSDDDQIEIQKIVGYLPGEISFIDDLDGYQ